MTWDEAKKWAAALDYAGHRDWRLPTKDELEQFAKKGGSSPAEWFNNSNEFNSVQSYGYWSSTANAGGTTYAWNISMSNGNVYDSFKTFSRYVWPVRCCR